MYTVLIRLSLLVGAVQSAMVCDRSSPPALYQLEGPDDCTDTEGFAAIVNVTTYKTSHYKVKGWLITPQEMTCTTHYFFWGSYSSTHSVRDVKMTMPDISQPTCPQDYSEYSTEEELLAHSKWSWPHETEVIKKVCRISPDILENSPSGYYINGLRAECADYTCSTETGALFLHTTSIQALDQKNLDSRLVEDAMCTVSYCLDLSTMSLYKVKKVVKTLPNWDSSYLSTTGEVVNVRHARTLSRSKRDSNVDIKRIMYLESDALRTSHKTKMLCHIINQLRTLFWMSTGVEPTILARQVLGHQDLVAEARESILLVWRCNPAAG